MSELSDLSELLTGAIVAQASVTRVVHANQLDEIQEALTTSLEAIPANCEVRRGAVLTYLDALDDERPEGPSDPPPRPLRLLRGKGDENTSRENERSTGRHPGRTDLRWLLELGLPARGSRLPRGTQQGLFVIEPEPTRWHLCRRGTSSTDVIARPSLRPRSGARRRGSLQVRAGARGGVMGSPEFLAALMDINRSNVGALSGPNGPAHVSTRWYWRSPLGVSKK